jgi:Asp-tRNA(Asn)/Glu-tRNA(Gln) amidotransferase A subunit family amidase
MTAFNCCQVSGPFRLPFTTGQLGLPIGLQRVGRSGDDHRLLAIAQ